MENVIWVRRNNLEKGNKGIRVPWRNEGIPCVSFLQTSGIEEGETSRVERIHNYIIKMPIN